MIQSHKFQARFKRERPSTGWLRFERRSRGLSIKRLAGLAEGVSIKRIRLFEVGRCLLDERERAAIAAALELAGPISASGPRRMRLIAGLRLRDVADRAMRLSESTRLSESLLSLWERGLASLDPHEEQLVKAVLSGGSNP